MRSYKLAMVALCAVPLAGAAACSDDANVSAQASSSSVSSGSGGQGGSMELCGTANGELDTESLELLSYDDGASFTHLREQNLTVNGYALNETSVHEAVRFELEHPARIYGFEVLWAALPEGIDPTAEMQAGLYGDFGYNGFDFWAPEPLWSGTRCAGDIEDNGETWTRYTFDNPVEVSHPGLVYVAHRAEPGSPVWWFDETVAGPEDNPCGAFADCQSAINLPEADLNNFFNGLSYPFQYHYRVRLYLEYTDDVQPADKLFQEVANGPTGRHATFVDYDKDGYDDLLAGGKLWHNQGDGSFVDVTESAGLTDANPTGGVWGDYDNDGCLDLFAFVESGARGETLLHSNCDGTFTDVTAASAIADVQNYEPCDDASYVDAPTAAAAWVDLDADGFVDLYLANFICWSKESYYVDTVWRNNGDGTFTQLGTDEGFLALKQPSRNVAPIDHDGDGDIDIMIGNYRLRANQFYENQGDGTFQQVASQVGLAGTSQGLAAHGHTIGTAWGDLDNDGDFDSVAANLAHPRFFDFSDKTQVLINDGTGHYSDLGGSWATPTSGAGLRYQETHSVPQLGDIDNNGNLDLAITCVYNGRPTDFYWGNGDGTFTLDAYHAGITTQNGWGMASADYDNDGDLDLFSQTLFTNTLASEAKGHWLQVHVTGTAANRAAIGATVKVTAAGVTRMRHVQGGSGKGGQSSLYLHFGLGDTAVVEQIQVVYPGGHTIDFAGPIATDQRVFVKEDESALSSGWAPPF